MRMIVIMMTTMRMTETLSSESSFRACFNQFAESCNKQEQKSAGVSFSNKEYHKFYNGPSVSFPFDFEYQA